MSLSVTFDLHPHVLSVSHIVTLPDPPKPRILPTPAVVVKGGKVGDFPVVGLGEFSLPAVDPQSLPKTSYW